VAFGALKLAEEKFPSSTNPHIQLLKMQLLHDRALHRYKAVSWLWIMRPQSDLLIFVVKIDLCRGHLRVAQQICDEFGVLSSSVSGVDIELKTEASLRHARTLLAAKQFSQVLNLLAYYSLPNKCLTHLIGHFNFIFSNGFTYSKCIYYFSVCKCLPLFYLYWFMNISAMLAQQFKEKIYSSIRECPLCRQQSWRILFSLHATSTTCK
jgi:hypothetical protein